MVQGIAVKRVRAGGKAVVAAMVVALASGGLLGVGVEPVAAAKPLITASYSGPVNCSATGKTKYSPGLTNAVASRAVSIKAKLSCSTGPTGTVGITVISGKLTLTGTHTGSCTTSNGPLNGSIKWKALGGKVNPTNISWPRLERSFGAAIVDRIDAGNGGSITSGSYRSALGQRGIEALLVNSGASQATCAAKNGIKKLAFTGSVAIKNAVTMGLCDDSTPLCMASFELGAGDGWLIVVAQEGQPARPSGTVTFRSPSGCASLPTVTLTPHTSSVVPGLLFSRYNYGPTSDWGWLTAFCPDRSFSYNGDAHSLRTTRETVTS
jgi:hypothetical protein